jgi:hypothetical protein
VTQSGLNGLLRRLAGGLNVSAAAPEALAFMRCCRVAVGPEGGFAHSDVSPGSLPIEFSFSQAREAVLRVLVEPCLPGEGILARTVLGLEAVGEATAALLTPELAGQAQEFVRRLLPEDEAIAGLSWRSSIWLALRTTGSSSAIRIYVNAQFSGDSNRWRRMDAALSACGLTEARAALTRVRVSVADLVHPIGLCFDLTAAGLVPARVHCVTDRISPFWLLRLLAETENQIAFEDLADFLDIFGLLERRGDCPILVSLGLEQNEAGSLKIDVDLPSARYNAEARRMACYLTKVEERFGAIAGYRAVSHIFEGVEPRYVGMSVAGTSRIVNAYFPGPPALPGEAPASPANPVEMEADFVRAQLAAGDGLAMDARSIGTVRAIPLGWRDVYMTSLLIQEASPAFPLEAGVLERARSYVRAARDGWGWRYLPDLPTDLDDTSMAWAALGSTDPDISRELAEQVTAMTNRDGGFPTFIGGVPQPSHQAVTLNVTFAMDRANICPTRDATDQYLAKWLRQPEFPSCEWIGARMFPVFLFARAAGLLERLGAWARQRLVTLIMGLRRADGSWGLGLPDSLETALAVLSLALLRVSVADKPDLARLLLDLQFGDGGWGWSPLYSDGSGTWFGHRAVTTMFAVRALDVLGCD